MYKKYSLLTRSGTLSTIFASDSAVVHNRIAHYSAKVHTKMKYFESVICNTLPSGSSTSLGESSSETSKKNGDQCESITSARTIPVIMKSYKVWLILTTLRIFIMSNLKIVYFGITLSI